ncbi:MAG TPA: glycosyltransferase family 39 protein [Candidatus Dormibacteraeota bacterium]|nr:glycosyltransferase family 39 protein [Candidatus Dormibacteraeota bacterium]
MATGPPVSEATETRRPPPWLAVVVALVLAAAVVLRFWTRSDMWLDEAQTVNIAKLPWSKIPSALRQDGSPPLYYFLLHFWMRIFGTGNLAVRSLSGVFGVLSLPLMWLAGRRLAGRTVAWIALALLASSPFAVRYSTENRMYMMMVVITLGGYLAVDAALRRPVWWRFVVVAVLAGLLALSHYWAFYIVASVVLLLVGLWWRGRERPPLWCAAAVIVGTVVSLAPWASALVFQLRHTGTPWSGRANFSAMVNAVSDYAGGSGSPGRALGLLFFALAGLGLFGVARDRWHIDLDLRTRSPGRLLTWLSFGTLGFGVLVGYLLDSAYQPRYTAVAFSFFILLVSVGVLAFNDQRVRYGVVGLAVALGLANSASNVTTDRTQAGQVARAIAAQGAPGDLVVYCPDQLGPGVSRLLPAGFAGLTYPRATAPDLVDWVDYAAVNGASQPGPFAQSALARAGPHAVWLVFSSDYATFGGKCQTLESDLAAARPHSRTVVLQNTTKFYEHENLDVFLAS